MLHCTDTIPCISDRDRGNRVNAAQNKGTEFQRLIRGYLPFFSLNMLGLIAVRIWIQCCLYDRYTSTDSGIITIAANFFRVLVIVITMAIIIRRGFSPRAQRRLASVSVAAMMLAAVLFLIHEETGHALVIWAACICAGFGIVWGGGMWICVYVRMQPGEALLYAFLSLAGSSFVGFFLGIMPESLTYLIAIMMPPLCLIAYQHAQSILDERDACGTAQTRYRITDNGKDQVYGSEPKTTFVRLIVGLALFNLALGIARGFPFGESIDLPLPFQALHQFGAVALSLGLIWWALVKRRAIRFSALWNISVTLIAAGVLFLAALDPFLTSIGATLIAITNTFSIGLLWFSSYDIARHSPIASYLVLGTAWTAHILPREIGRAAIWAIDPHSIAAIIITAFIILLLAGSMVFLLNDSTPLRRPLFAEFRAQAKPGFWREKTLDAQKGAYQAVLVSGNGGESGVSVSGISIDSTPIDGMPIDGILLGGMEHTSATPIKLETGQTTILVETTKMTETTNTLEIQLEALKNHCFLTEREIEVVRFLAQGRSKTCIGQKLFISENTVRTYVKNIYSKLNVHNKQQLLDRLEDAGS